MIDLSRDTHSLSDFKDNTAEHLNRIKSTGMPEVLTVDGQAALVVQDAAAYQRLLEQLDDLEALNEVRASLERVRSGVRGMTPKEVLQSIARQTGLEVGR